MRGTCQHRAPLIIAETSCVRLSFHQGQNFSVCGQLCGQTKKGPRQLAKPFLFFGDKRACRCGDLISIHAPARGATTAGIGANLYLAFQSTPPARGATAETAKISSCFYNNQIIFTNIPPNSRHFPPKIELPTCRKHRKLWCETAEISCALALCT